MSDERPRILATLPMKELPEARSILEERAEVTYAPYPAEEELLRLIADQDALVPNLRQRVDRRVIAAGLRLRVIATPSTGTDHIDIPFAQSRGILVQSIARDYDLLRNLTATAEHAFLLMLACLRKLPFAFDAVRQGSWTKEPFRGRQVRDRAYGIIGYGRLGEMVSRYGQAFGMRVLACDPQKRIADPWVTQMDLDSLLREAEILTLHVHLTPETTHMIGERAFALMRPGAYLINTSRGKVIDEAALLRALESGRLAGAAVDVLATELDGEIAENPLVKYARGHDNLVITPHMGGCTRDSQQLSYSHMARKLVAALQSAPAVGCPQA